MDSFWIILILCMTPYILTALGLGSTLIYLILLILDQNPSNWWVYTATALIILGVITYLIETN